MTYMSVYPSIGERILSQAGSNIISCRCDDGGSSDSVRSFTNVYNTHAQNISHSSLSLRTTVFRRKILPNSAGGFTKLSKLEKSSKFRS